MSRLVISTGMDSFVVSIVSGRRCQIKLLVGVEANIRKERGNTGRFGWLVVGCKLGQGKSPATVALYISDLGSEVLFHCRIGPFRLAVRIGVECGGCSIPRHSQSLCQKAAASCGTQSEAMVFGSPWSRKMWFRNMSATSGGRPERYQSTSTSERNSATPNNGIRKIQITGDWQLPHSSPATKFG